MALFHRKSRQTALNILNTLEGPAPHPTAQILEGDESRTTPVEDAALGKMGHLYPFSPIVLALIRLFDREGVDIQEIVDLVGSDATLAAETLAFVNSALFAMQEKVTSLHHAIAVLGSDNMRSLATTLAMRSMLACAPKPAVVRRVWKHSIATAVIASDLASIYGVASGLASTAGVLHDIGRMGLLAQYSETYSHMLLRQFDDVESILAEERSTCALDHCDVGLLLGKVWNLPGVFAEVAAGHHDAKANSGPVGLIRTACVLADTLSYAAISYRAVPTAVQWVNTWVPEALREQITIRFEAASQEIVEKIEALDF